MSAVLITQQMGPHSGSVAQERLFVLAAELLTAS